MNDFLNSLKADLTDRRLLPIVALVVVAVVGTVAYALLSGGGGSPTSAAVAPSPVTHGLAVVQIQAGAGKAVAETTSGTSAQRSGTAHNPFTLLPSAVKATSVTTATASAASAAAPASSSSSKSGTSSSKGSGTSTSTPAPAPSSSSKPSTPAKPRTLYKVAVEFGVLPPGVLPQNAELHSYVDLSSNTPLPSAKHKLVEAIGVIATHSSKSVAFSVFGEVILHGAGVCLPSATQCKVIALKEGQAEQLEYLSESGQVTVYELRVVSIASSTASAASISKVLSAQAHAASRLLGRDGPLRVAGLHFSAQAGVLAFDRHRAFGARAHASQHPPR